MNRLIIIVSIVLSNTLAAKDKITHDPFQGCQKAYDKEMEKSPPTPVFRHIHWDAKECTKVVMNKELDKILIPLKKANPAKFKKAMAEQAKFNSFAKDLEATWDKYYEKCCSTCGFEEVSEELMTLYKWRSDHLFENNIADWKKQVSGPADSCD